jgi:SAM-dependent methyltransferase
MKREAPAAARNREPITAVLTDELPASGMVLEVASGTGEHAIHFAAAFPHLHWQPSDPDADALASIAAWRADAGLANVAPPLKLDAAADTWPLDSADALLCINMIHISPLAAAHGLVSAAGRLLPPGGPLIVYGPWLEADVKTADSNLAFDQWLKDKDAQFGLRDTAWMDGLAAAAGLVRARRVAMPANNIMLVYRKV